MFTALVLVHVDGQAICRFLHNAHGRLQHKSLLHAEIELSRHHRQHDYAFVHRELLTDARATSTAERQERWGVVRVKVCKPLCEYWLLELYTAIVDMLKGVKILRDGCRMRIRTYQAWTWGAHQAS